MEAPSLVLPIKKALIEVREKGLLLDPFFFVVDSLHHCGTLLMSHFLNLYGYLSVSLKPIKSMRCDFQNVTDIHIVRDVYPYHV